MNKILDIIVGLGKNFNLKDYLLILLINFLFIIIFYILFSFAFKNKKQVDKINTLIKFNLILFIFYYTYKLIYYFVYNGSFTDLIPLHLCNINLILNFISFKIKNPKLIGFSFYTVTIGASLAIIFSDKFIDGLSFSHPLALGFYLFHSGLVTIALLSLKLDIFRPSYKNTIPVLKTFLCLSFIIYFINIIFEKFFGLSSNYFYQTNPNTVAQLKLFYNIIPVEFLYLVPVILIMTFVMFLIGVIFDLSLKIKNYKKENKLWKKTK